MSTSSLRLYSSLRPLFITSFVSVYWLTALKKIAGAAAPKPTVYYTIDNPNPPKAWRLPFAFT